MSVFLVQFHSPDPFLTVAGDTGASPEREGHASDHEPGDPRLSQLEKQLSIETKVSPAPSREITAVNPTV